MSREDRLADTIKLDYRQADLSARERAMLDYVHKLTLTPHATRRADVESLRATGFDDLGSLHMVLLTSWFNYINRVPMAGRGARHAHVGDLRQAQALPWELESGSMRPQPASQPV